MRLLPALACGLALAVPPAALAQSPSAAALRDPGGPVMVAAHRGCWSEWPENSIAALEACIALGVDIVEVDLRLTRDGELVLLHDASPKRMTGSPGRVAERDFAEVSSLNLRNRDGRKGEALTEYRVASFRDMVRAARGRILLILDMKDDPALVAPAAAAVLREEGACDIALFALVASPEAVRETAGDLFGCAAYLPNLRVPMGPMSEVARSYADLDPVAVAVRFDDWSYLEEGAAAVRAMGVRLWVNTLDPPHAAGLVDADALKDPDRLWGRLIDAGVNMIQTDEPAALIDYLRARGLRDPAG